jgi:phosphoribosylformylglycinamidine cyclo-ligase
MSAPMAISYRQAGVDIDAGEELVQRIKPLAHATRTPFVLDGIGGFAGLCGLPTGLEEPVLVSGTDGVGTKLKIAFETNCHSTIGQDLVAMCANDVATTGAALLFFLDYFGCGKLDVDVAEAVIGGIADGCKLANCALLGGETAELPNMYAPNEYDLAGFAVGVASKKALLGPNKVQLGDELVAVASSGLHSNGYSLARRVLQQELKLSLDKYVPELGITLGEELLKPTRIYVRAIQALLAALPNTVHSICHVTGGGIVGNLNRVLAKHQQAVVTLDHEQPAVFNLIKAGGPVEQQEMLRTFNLGIGLVLCVKAGTSKAVCDNLRLNGEKAWAIGTVEPNVDATPLVVVR